jgi:hypothetical protein
MVVDYAFVKSVRKQSDGGPPETFSVLRALVSSKIFIQFDTPHLFPIYTPYGTTCQSIVRDIYVGSMEADHKDQH